jgi:hypothetical protein
MTRKAWLIAATLLSTSIAQAACYSVYKADGTLLQESSTPPVNLSMQIGDTVPAMFGPGATMTMSDNAFYCRDKREEAQMAQKSLAGALRAEEEKGAAFAIKKPAEGGDGAQSTAAR